MINVLFHLVIYYENSYIIIFNFRFAKKISDVEILLKKGIATLPEPKSSVISNIHNIHSPDEKVQLNQSN